MGFFGRFFGGGTQAYKHATDESIDRANVYVLAPDDTRLAISSFSRQRVAEKAEWARQNFGIVQEWARGIARHSIGRGIMAQFNTPDADWNREATLAVDHFMLSPSQCDLSGRRNGYEQQLYLVEQLVILGESFTAFVENEKFPSPKGGVGACPSFFNIAASDIRTPRMKETMPIHDGILLGPQGQAVKFYARSWGKDEFTTYDAMDVAHIFEAHAAHQSRGVSPLAPGLTRLVDIHELQRLEVRTAKAQRQVALVIKGLNQKQGRGAFAKIEAASSTGNGTTGSTANDTAQMENLYGGAGAAIARLGEDGSVDLLSSMTPGPALSQFFNDLLLRDASAAIGIPLEFFWGGDTGGANLRGIYARADSSFQQFADKVIYRFFEPLIVRFIRWRIASGLLAEPKGAENGAWLDCMTYRRPRRVTLDNGRDAKARISDLDHGLANLRGLFDEMGEDWRPETVQWINEWVEFKRMCVEAGLSESEATKLMDRWRPPVPGSQQPIAQTAAQPAPKTTP